jgi:ataxia telangiectasia mutated family protein
MHKDALLTVIGVVVHDPLYNWQMTPVKARKRQQDVEDDDPTSAAAAAGVSGPAAAGAGGGGGGVVLGNADAERVVLRVRQKLEGLDSSEGEPRGVVGQVAGLLAEAQDPDNLGRMYVGWAAWM